MTDHMVLPEGRHVEDRVVADPSETLRTALSEGVTGYVTVDPVDGDAADDAGGVITFRAGVPVAVRSTRGRAGPRALADLVTSGMYHVELVAAPADEIRSVERGGRVQPGMPAERLAGDPDLADRTREVAPDEWVEERPTTVTSGESPGRWSADPGATAVDGGDAVAAFLEDEKKIARIREEAREQARERAAEWGLTDHLR
jgi:hypothetical protein